MKPESKWTQVELHIKPLILNKREELRSLLEKLLPVLYDLYSCDLYGSFYFNRYLNEKEGLAFLKLGFRGVPDSKVEEILARAVAQGAEVRPGAPDLREVDGIVIDDIKEMSTRAAGDIFMVKKPSLEQASLFTHFLMNCLGFTYWDEMKVYTELLRSIVHQGGEAEG